MTQLFAVVLAPNTPKEIHALLGGHLLSQASKPTLEFFFCRSIEHLGYFVEFGIVKDKNSKPWVVQIPSGCVLAIAEMRKGKMPPGFLSDGQ